MFSSTRMGTIGCVWFDSDAMMSNNSMSPLYKDTSCVVSKSGFQPGFGTRSRTMSSGALMLGIGDGLSANKPTSPRIPRKLRCSCSHIADVADEYIYGWVSSEVRQPARNLNDTRHGANLGLILGR